MCRLLLAAVLISSAALMSCSGPVPPGGVTGVCADATHSEAAYFTETMLPIFESHCTVCHGSDKQAGEGIGTRRGAPGYLNYDLLQSATLAGPSTWERVADRTMPPMGRELTYEELETILSWVNCTTDLSGDDDDSAQ